MSKYFMIVDINLWRNKIGGERINKVVYDLFIYIVNFCLFFLYILFGFYVKEDLR